MEAIGDVCGLVALAVGAESVPHRFTHPDPSLVGPSAPEKAKRKPEGPPTTVPRACPPHTLGVCAGIISPSLVTHPHSAATTRWVTPIAMAPSNVAASWARHHGTYGT
jgi:hypothetical protein